eukprot:CAMPEP_0206395518 /NCGR_PEP_ID=MMETSP0294-20121207/22135_1 /ASSEMBLY_ACC=CAM_ASM_000327 /TAXON_ID=39354 /ORGANISM="Heterosigma akashiwo, Strain CCMP2393" /LENGTH=52 /DNA_ID=CAMNT_0053849869 /DNA_START=15 /DNA_END=170 /DNA_ORIENTATION=+
MPCVLCLSQNLPFLSPSNLKEGPLLLHSACSHLFLLLLKSTMPCSLCCAQNL